MANNNIGFITTEYIRGIGRINNYSKDIKATVSHLYKNGYEKVIPIVSVKALAGLNSYLKNKNNIKQVALLGPSYGEELKYREINKLFILAKKDIDYPYTKEIFDKSSTPKILKEYD